MRLQSPTLDWENRFLGLMEKNDIRSMGVLNGSIQKEVSFSSSLDSRLQDKMLSLEIVGSTQWEQWEMVVDWIWGVVLTVNGIRGLKAHKFPRPIRCPWDSANTAENSSHLCHWVQIPENWNPHKITKLQTDDEKNYKKSCDFSKYKIICIWLMLIPSAYVSKPFGAQHFIY